MFSLTFFLPLRLLLSQMYKNLWIATVLPHTTLRTALLSTAVYTSESPSDIESLSAACWGSSLIVIYNFYLQRRPQTLWEQ